MFLLGVKRLTVSFSCKDGLYASPWVLHYNLTMFTYFATTHHPISSHLIEKGTQSWHGHAHLDKNVTMLIDLQIL